MIRAFVGLPVPVEVADMLEAAQTGLRHGRLVPAENFHVTLAFLDSHPERVIEDVHDMLSEIDLAPLEIKVEALGTFGSARPRAVFAEVVPSTGLTALRRHVRRAVREAGIELEHKRFHPHVTLARFGSGLPEHEIPDLQAWISRRMTRVRGGWTADRFCLYRSDLTGDAPIYEVLAAYPLR